MGFGALSCSCAQVTKLTSTSSVINSSYSVNVMICASDSVMYSAEVAAANIIAIAKMDFMVSIRVKDVMMCGDVS